MDRLINLKDLNNLENSDFRGFLAYRVDDRKKRKKLQKIETISRQEVIDTIEDFKRWIFEERRLSENTLISYELDLKIFLNYLFDSKSKKQIALVDRKGVTHSSNARIISTLRNFFRFLNKTDGKGNNQIENIRLPKISKPLPKPISIDDIKVLIREAAERPKKSWIGKRDQAIFTILYCCGLRITEALSLNNSDIPVEDTMLIRGKGDKKRIVPVLPVVRDTIKQYTDLRPFNHDHDDPLFVGARGKRLKARVVQRQMEEIRRDMGLPNTATPHALRHSFATHLLINGGALADIRKLLGHSSLSSTQRYTAIDPNRLMEVYNDAHPRAKRN